MEPISLELNKSFRSDLIEWNKARSQTFCHKTESKASSTPLCSLFWESLEETCQISKESSEDHPEWPIDQQWNPAHIHGRNWQFAQQPTTNSHQCWSSGPSSNSSSSSSSSKTLFIHSVNSFNTCSSIEPYYITTVHLLSVQGYYIGYCYFKAIKLFYYLWLVLNPN